MTEQEFIYYQQIFKDINYLKKQIIANTSD